MRPETKLRGKILEMRRSGRCNNSPVKACLLVPTGQINLPDPFDVMLALSVVWGEDVTDFLDLRDL
jgi:hypothetical protein